jgi:hypothetical protein
MGWLSKSKGAWDLAAVERPWQAGTSIYDHIQRHLSPDGQGLTEGGARLPDEKDDGELKWVAGGLDGAFGHHGGGGAKKDRARMLHRALAVVLEDASAAKVRKLYQQILDDSAIDYIDPLLQLVVEKGDLDARRLEELAVWLATNSPDRQPVKIALALLGVIPGADRSDLLLTLGSHEELTLYAAVALANSGGDGAERKLLALARQVHGWGRISIVERLADTADPIIKAWMLRDGYRNSIMVEYLAYTCASAGGLRAELEKESADPVLLRGAGEIIRALIAGGPAQDIDDYADGAVVVERYLHHVDRAVRAIEHLVTASHIEGFLDGKKADWKAREGRGWTPHLRDALREKILAMKALSDWGPLVDTGLASDDRAAFYEADEAAKALGIDTWERHFARLEPGDVGGWFFVMKTEDPARIDRVVAFAEKTIPLDKIATGPARENGLGRGWADHGSLDFVLQELRRFPGKGWPLIRAGLRSPVIRNRYMALRALSPWGRGNWPAGAEAALRAVLVEEPEADVRKEIELLLAGRQIEDSGP